MDKLNVKKIWFEIIQELIGSFLIAIATSLFLLPNELSSGGFAGIATISYYIFHIPMGLTILALNIPIFIFAHFKIGQSFFFKSLIGTISLSYFIDFLNNFSALTNNKIIACIYGGILTGLGTAIILRVNASTGGSDLLSLLIKTHNSVYKTGSLIIIIDFIIVCLNVILLQKIEIGIYSAITIYLTGKVINILFEEMYV